MADVPWDQDVTTDDTTPVSEWNAFKDRLISIAGDKSIGDGFLLVKQGTTADRPSAGYDGRMYYSTDEGIWYRDNGSSWIELVRGESEIRLAQLSEKDYSSLTNVPSTFPPEAHSIGGAEHNSDTLASLNGLIDDATLDDMESTRPPESHNIAGSAHGTSTIRDFNGMIDDATLDDKGNKRPPESHGKRDHSDIDQALETTSDVEFGSVTTSNLQSVTDIGFTVSDTSIYDFDNDGTVGVTVRGSDKITIETYESMLGTSVNMMTLEQGTGNISHQTLSMSSNKITDLADPSDRQDAATKGWVEGNFNNYSLETHGNKSHDKAYSATPVSDVETAGLSMQANINPDKDVNRQLGEGTAGSDDADIRWSEIHAVDIYGTVHNNDLAFTEKRCEVCGEEFQEGDRVSLIVNEVREDGTYMVPKHEAC